MPTEIQFDAADAQAPLRLVTPVHDVASGEAAKAKALVKRRPGRPRKVELRPTLDDLSYHAEMMNERERLIASDPLVNAVREKADTRSIMTLVIQQIAEEAGSLAFDAREAQKRGRDAAQTSTRRVEALKKVAEIQLQLRELEGETWNLASERFQKLFALWVERLSAVLREVLVAEQVDLVLSRLAAAMETWEQDAADIT